jgi:hypothetical protein
MAAQDRKSLLVANQPDAAADVVEKQLAELLELIAVSLRTGVSGDMDDKQSPLALACLWHPIACDAHRARGGRGTRGARSPSHTWSRHGARLAVFRSEPVP